MLSLQIILTEKSLVIKLFHKKSVIKKLKHRGKLKNLTSKEGKRRLGGCEIVQILFGQNMNMRSKPKSSKNVNLCLLDSVESIAQGIKIL